MLQKQNASVYGRGCIRRAVNDWISSTWQKSPAWSFCVSFCARFRWHFSWRRTYMWFFLRQGKRTHKTILSADY